VAIKKNQEVLEAKAKMKRASEDKMTEAREKMAALRKGKQDLVSCSSQPFKSVLPDGLFS
jgi:hypothetical protein